MKPLIGLSLFTLATLSASGEDAVLTVADLKFKFAPPWKAVESSSPMRAGTLQVAVEGSDKPAEAVFYYFGAGQGGDVEANVTRWFSQFEGEPEKNREEVTVGDKKITVVKATGTYLDGPPFGPKTPKAGYALLGAIVPAAEANVFIKFTGPKDGVMKLLESFKKIAASPFAK
ncbi:MAG: hypothetical protein K1X78_04045 [Verrucomicrobiaceae bacterium]|nr:hypothetical protein [Verrucomicrobiaceae bacterium]